MCCSVAVQTPIGLMVPIVRDADQKGLAQIAGEVKQLAAKVGVPGGRLACGGPDCLAGGANCVAAAAHLLLGCGEWAACGQVGAAGTFFPPSP